MKKANFAENGSGKTILLSLFFFFLISSQIFGQKQVFNEAFNVTYTFSVVNDDTDTLQYINAMNKANFKYHRLRERRNTIKFEDGVEIVLFSAEELLLKGLNINVNDFPVEIQNYYPPIFKVVQNDFIIEQRPVMNSKQ